MNSKQPDAGGNPNSGVEQLKGHVLEAGAGLQQTASETGQQIKRTASEAKEQIKQKGSEAFEQVGRRAQEMAGHRKDTVVEKLQHCSAASKTAADQLRQNNEPKLAEYAESIAQQIDRSAEYVRQREFRGMFEDSEDFARRQPEIFFGGMFIAGLAAARFLKASSSRSRPELSERFERSEPALSETPPVSTPISSSPEFQTVGI